MSGVSNTRDKKTEDQSIHRQIIGAVNFTQSKATPDTVERMKALGLTEEEISELVE